MPWGKLILNGHLVICTEYCNHLLLSKCSFCTQCSFNISTEWKPKKIVGGVHNPNLPTNRLRSSPVYRPIGLSLKCLCIENFEYTFLAKIETSVFPMHEYHIIFVLTGEKGVEISICFEALGANFDSHCVMS